MLLTTARKSNLGTAVTLGLSLPRDSIFQILKSAFTKKITWNLPKNHIPANYFGIFCQGPMLHLSFYCNKNRSRGSLQIKWCILIWLLWFSWPFKHFQYPPSAVTGTWHILDKKWFLWIQIKMIYNLCSGVQQPHWWPIATG